MKKEPVGVGERYRCSDARCGFEVVVTGPPRSRAILPYFECCSRSMEKVRGGPEHGRLRAPGTGE